MLNNINIRYTRIGCDPSAGYNPYMLAASIAADIGTNRRVIMYTSIAFRQISAYPIK